MQVAEFFQDRSVIVTGGVGSIGRRIVESLLDYGAERVRVIDSNEAALFEMGQIYASDPRAQFFQCDICDEREMTRLFAGFDYCFHAAGLKHVPSCERSPFSAIKVNIGGSESVIRAAMDGGLRKVVFTSSDKAVNPTNVMGTSKLMCERMFTAMNSLGGPGRHTVFASTRFGNVAGSQGSVIPLFCDQIRRGGPVTLTDPRMTRFMMSIDEAARLVLESMTLAKGGEVFVTKMPVIAISDLAAVLIRMVAPLNGFRPSDIPVEVVGARPGEKLWEELSTDEETGRLLVGDRFLVVMPAMVSRSEWDSFRGPPLNMARQPVVYHSDREKRMTEGEIEAFLTTPGVLPGRVLALLAAVRADERLRCAS